MIFHDKPAVFIKEKFLKLRPKEFLKQSQKTPCFQSYKVHYDEDETYPYFSSIFEFRQDSVEFVLTLFEFFFVADIGFRSAQRRA